MLYIFNPSVVYWETETFLHIFALTFLNKEKNSEQSYSYYNFGMLQYLFRVEPEPEPRPPKFFHPEP
jgi:hypothetical protein